MKSKLSLVFISLINNFLPGNFIRLEKNILIFLIFIGHSFSMFPQKDISRVQEPRMVFGFFMVGMITYGTAVENYREEIREAKAAGMDGFAINLPGWNAKPYWKPYVKNIFEAAKQEDPNFKLFFAPGYSTNLAAWETVDMIRTYESHPNYYKYQNRPLMTTFIGVNKGEVYWRDSVIEVLQSKGIDIFFLPHAPVIYQGVRVNSWPAWADTLTDGYSYFAAGLSPDSQATTGETVASICAAQYKSFMAGLSPYFWLARDVGVDRRNYEHLGGEGFATQWNSIITKQQPKWVQIVTWNDYTETYISPVNVDDKVKALIPNYGIRDLLKHHNGYTELNKYYIEWYKTGTQPAITKDRLFYFYRTHPKDLIAPNDTLNPVTFETPISDEIYVTTMLTAPAQLSVTTGGKQTTYQVGAGIQHTRIPFLPGKQLFSLSRNSSIILSAEGEPILSSITHYNFIPTTGVITATGLTTNISDIHTGNEYVRLYPNFSSGTVTIDFDLRKNEMVKISIYNLEGKEVYNSRNQMQQNSHSINLNLENLPDGFYFFNLETSEFSVLRKLVLSK